MKRKLTRYRAGWRVLATGEVGYSDRSDDQRAIKADLDGASR